MSGQCTACGARLEDQPDSCVACGASQQLPNPVSAQQAGEPQRAPELFSAAETSADASLIGIGGWLILPAIGLALAPVLNLFALIADGRLLFNSGAREYLSMHAGLYLLILFEVISNVVFILYIAGLNMLLYAKRKAFPVAMIVFLAANVVVISIDQISLAQLDLPAKSTQFIRALIAAAIWIPYFMRSRRVAHTFVR